jgi:hypothetical protein
MLKIGAIVATPFLISALFLGATGVLLVDVREGGPDGTHIVFPVPLIVAQAALSLAPAEARYVKCENFGRYQEIAVRLAEELSRCPDFIIAEVVERDESVLVRKEGTCITVDVKEANEQVHCRLPLKAVARILASYDGEGFSTSAMIRALRSAPRGDLVHVRDGQDEVRITRL